MTDDVQQCYNQARDLLAAKQPDKALACLEQVPKAAHDTDTLALTGVIHYQLNHLEQAEDFLNQAIAADERNPKAYYNLGLIQEAGNKQSEAVESYQTSIGLDPSYTNPMIKLAAIYEKQYRLEDAAKLCRDALKRDANNVDAYTLLGGILCKSGLPTEGIAASQQAVDLLPENPALYSTLLFHLNYAYDIEPEAIFKAHRNGDKLLPGNYSSHPATFTKPGRRLRIGYVSADFKRHSVAFFIEPILHLHDQDRFEIFCYADVEMPDEITSRITGHVEHWRDIKSLPDDQLRQRIIDDKIDILVDLSGHTGKRLAIFAERSAPVQMTYLGYPNTTGLRNMDYRLVDDITDPPEAKRLCREKLCRLPGGMWAYAPPAVAPEPTSPPCGQNGYFTFGSFNNMAKQNPLVLQAWCEILKQVPNARLCLKSKALQDTGVAKRLYAIFAEHGLAKEQLVLMPFAQRLQDHMGCYNQIDLALDPFPYNGTTTTFEACWMGVPTLTLAGNTHHSRVGASIMSRLELQSFIAPDQDSYINKAVQLAQNPSILAQLRPVLRNILANSPLCDALTKTRDLEQIYTQLINRG